jgi:hypothetical protein
MPLPLPHPRSYAFNALLANTQIASLALSAAETPTTLEFSNGLVVLSAA